MAGVIGSSGGGYATINPTQGNPIANAMQDVEHSAFEYSAQKMANQRAQQEAQEAQRKERANQIEISDNYKKENPFVATGITDVDSQNRASLENAKNARSQAIDDYSRTGDKKYLAVIHNIDTGVDEMKSFADAYTNHVKNVVEGTANGTYNMKSAETKAANLDEIKGKIVRRFDANGNSIFDVLKTDEDGVITVVKSGLNSKQLIDYNTPVKAFHIDGLNTPPGYKGKTLVDDYNLKLGKPSKEYMGRGLNRKEKIYYPDAPKVAKTMAETAVKSKDNLYEIFSRMGIDPEDESNYQNTKLIDNARQYLEKTLLDTSSEVISESPDTAYANLEESKRQHNQTQKNADREYNRNVKNDAIKEAGSTTVTDTKQELTAKGIKAEKDFYANPENKGYTMLKTDYPPGSYITRKTTVKKNEKSNPVKTIPAYSISDLKKAGWNDTQIKQAVEEGKIKTK